MAARGWRKLRGPLRPANTIRLITRSLTYRQLKALSDLTGNPETVADLLQTPRPRKEALCNALRTVGAAADKELDRRFWERVKAQETIT
jgi:hypothetical protein